ncbi:MAG: VanZ family protein [Nitrospirota bacterium]
MPNLEERQGRTAVIYWFITLGYMVTIFYLSSLRNLNLPSLPQNSDKVLHMLAYILLAFLFYHTFKKSGIRKYVFILAFLSASIYGISDEIHQYYVPGREAAIGDLFADFFGAMIGCMGASFMKS